MWEPIGPWAHGPRGPWAQPCARPLGAALGLALSLGVAWLRKGESTAQGIRIIYGGSLKANNARPLMALADVDGGLIGGASLTSMDFIAIAESCP